MDRIDQLINVIGEEIPEVIWDRDAVDVARPEDWGAVELRSEPDSQWADGREIDTIHALKLYLCVSDRESGWKKRIEDALKRYDEECAWIDWHMDDRVWMPQIDKTLWTWTVRMLEGLEIPEEPEDDPEPDGPEDEPEDPENEPDGGEDAEAAG